MENLLFALSVATSIKEMGLVIKNVNAKANGRTDGKTISTIVKRLLS